MVVVPEKQPRYWRNRSPYPRHSPGDANDGLSDDSIDGSNGTFRHKVQQVDNPVRRADVQPSPRHEVTDWTPSSTQEHYLKSPLKRSITWDAKYAPWNTNCLPHTDAFYINSPSEDFKRLSQSEGINSDDFLDRRSPSFYFIQPKPTAADHSRPPLYNAKNDSVRMCSSLDDSLKSPRLSTKPPRVREPLNATHLLGRRRSGIIPSPLTGLPVQWPTDTSTAATSSRGPDSNSDSERDLGVLNHDEKRSAFSESRRGHRVDCGTWRRGGMDKQREACLNAGIDLLAEATEKRAERMDELAVWLVVGLIGVWVLLILANLKLAEYEVALKSMR
ncbi:hypothetical protein CSUB01_05323 [Colletotrichum sublineola]|uniref:Uncharacterized protein n=1 Tax=Colletotrichum sublineola TaxID=1173701 RepID=A0A066X357_COLSU|nr:hypothetical protein CSUB01_05323 [Colletotrichum sublineola]